MRTQRTSLVWLASGAVLAGAIAVAGAVMRVLVHTPSTWLPVVLACAVAVGAGVVAACVPSWQRHASRALATVFVTSGIVVLVLGSYLVVVGGFFGSPHGEERRVLALSMVAAAVALVLLSPVHRRLRDVSDRWLRDDRQRPTAALQTFGARMTRAVPMDELLLQLAETLRDSIAPLGAEIWTGRDGRLEQTVSVPERSRSPIQLRDDDVHVVARGRAVGNAWISVWLPSLLVGREDQQLRVAPVAHLGELLGLLVVARADTDAPYDDVSDAVLTDLARQVGLALHNVQLDSALQASLEQLRRRNEELQASRARIIAAADASRREIERNLHDGAQQHLVALAVKLGLVRQLLDDGSPQAAGLLDDMRGDVRTTIDAVRELAHGIYPPLLRDRGLAEALLAAADRNPLPVTVDVATTTRYPADAETAVYFCCLEAMQNAAKHAGSEAHVTIRVSADNGRLRFEVRDTGRGFDATTLAGGHGFVNMADRLGAMGGEVSVESAPGAGTCISGWVPCASAVMPDADLTLPATATGPPA